MTAVSLEKKQLKKELFTFVIVTFAVTFIFSLAIYLILGPISVPVPKLWFSSLQVYMFIPAGSAIFCMFFFKSKAMTKETKIIFSIFLIYVVAFLLESYGKPFLGTMDLPLVSMHPTKTTEIPLVSMIIAVLGILILIILNLKMRWRNNLKDSKLFFGTNLSNYLILPLILSAVIILTYILNYISGLGVPDKEYNLYLFFAKLIPSLILSIFVLWPNYFGEEYGWRAYLQDRLFPLFGSYKGVLILGIIWGLWHIPLILIGILYPGQSVLGIVLMVFNTIVMGVIFSYAVLKTGSVWIAVLLHLIPDTIYPTANLYIATSINPIFSFGTGIYGTALLTVFALILLKSDVWKRERLQRLIER